MSEQAMEFEVKYIKQRLAQDGQKLDYDKMTDEDIARQGKRDYSFKFMETAADKEFLKHQLNNRLKQAKLK